MIRNFFSRTGIAIVVGTLGLFATLFAAGPTELIGKPAPLFTGKTLNGTVVNLEDLRGKVVLLDFWAKWCPSCRKALPKIQSVAKRFENQNVVVLGVNLDYEETPEVLKAFLKTNGVTFDVVHDVQGALSDKYDVRSIPCAVTIDKDGIVRFVHTGDSPTLGMQLGDQIADLL